MRRVVIEECSDGWWLFAVYIHEIIAVVGRRRTREAAERAAAVTT